MSDKNKQSIAAVLISACLVVSGLSFYMGIVTIASLTNEQDVKDATSETRVEGFRIENHLNPSNRIFLTLDLSKHIEINYIIAKCDIEPGLYYFYIIPALSINGSANITIGTTTNPMFQPLEIKNVWQYAYPGNKSLVLSVDPTARLILSLYRNTGGPNLSFDVRISYTIYNA